MRRFIALLTRKMHLQLVKAISYLAPNHKLLLGFNFEWGILFIVSSSRWAQRNTKKYFSRIKLIKYSRTRIKKSNKHSSFCISGSKHLLCGPLFRIPCTLISGAIAWLVPGLLYEPATPVSYSQLKRKRASIFTSLALGLLSLSLSSFSQFSSRFSPPPRSKIAPCLHNEKEREKNKPRLQLPILSHHVSLPAFFFFLRYPFFFSEPFFCICKMTISCAERE